MAAQSAQGSESSRGQWAQSVYRSVSIWVETCVEYYEAAAMYEDLRRLSDAELRRCGLSRETLARDVCRGLGRS